jgi:D-apionolactonase
MTQLRTSGRRPDPRGFSRPILWYARPSPLPRVRTIQCGPVQFDLDGVDVARVRSGDTELVNRLYMSVRDRNWDTVLPVFSDLRVKTMRKGVVVTFNARNQAGPIDFGWTGSIAATVDGRLTYEMEGEALSAFEYCRIGFCVLHSEAAAAGRPYFAETPGGVVSGVLPRLIAPQEIRDGHEVPLIPPCSSLAIQLDDISIRAAFDGSLFSSEDQRNWTDASFKTCSIAGPDYPYPAARGQHFAQRVTLVPSGSAPPAKRRRASPVGRIEVGEAQGGTWPALGVGLPSEPTSDAGPRQTARLAKLALDHVRADVHLASAYWPVRLDRSRRAARVIGAQLELALFMDASDVERLPALADALAHADLARVIVLPTWTPSTRTTSPPMVDVVRAILAPVLGQVAVAGGTDGDFAELNRDRPSVDSWDGVAYSINPQVHAFDERSLVETLATQATTVATTRSFAGSTPVIVSPITLRQRFNPSAIDDQTIGHTDLPSSSVDPRQMSLFGAGWTLGSIASLTAVGASSLTYFETVGLRGLLDAGGRRSGGGSFPARPGMAYPMFHVFADLADRRETIPMTVVSTNSELVAAAALDQGGIIRVMVANLSGSRLPIVVGPFGGHVARIRALDDDTAEEAMLAPARFRRRHDRIAVRRGQLSHILGPFAYARIDAEARGGRQRRLARPPA